jgi:enoyl-CoA hydratase/carnithine racemase
MELFFTCQPLSVQRAYEVGFVNRIVAGAELIPEATKMAEIISTMAPLVLKSLKTMGYRDHYSVHREGTAIRLQMVEAMRESEDAQEGFRAFVEKREPDFRGR